MHLIIGIEEDNLCTCGGIAKLATREHFLHLGAQSIQRLRCISIPAFEIRAHRILRGIDKVLIAEDLARRATVSFGPAGEEDKWQEERDRRNRPAPIAKSG